MAIHIHLARAAKPVRDAVLKSSFGTAAEHQSKARELKAAGNEEAAKHHGRAASVLQQAEAESTHSINKKDPATVAYTVKQLLETAEKHVQAARSATKDSVESVEKEIRTQQRLIDVAKRMGKDVPGTVTQRMAFLKEELEKAKNPRTEDSSSHTEEVDEDRYKDLKVGQKLTWKGKKVEVKGKSVSPKKTVNGNMIPEKFTVTFETTDSAKDAEEFKPREEFKNVMLKSQDAFRAARNVVMLAGRAGDKGAAAKAQAIADLLDRAADMAHGLA